MDTTWWGALTSIEKVYWIITIAASTILAVQLIMAFFTGFDSPGNGDFDVEHDGGMGGDHFQLLTVRNFVAFFAMMGWSGLAFYHMGLSTILCVGLSIFCGFVMMVITAAIFFGLAKLQSSGTLNLNAAVNSEASVYLKIPPEQNGAGQITFVLQGKKVEMEAVTMDKEDIPTGATVRINTIKNSRAVVERIKG